MKKMSELSFKTVELIDRNALMKRLKRFEQLAKELCMKSDYMAGLLAATSIVRNQESFPQTETQE